MLKPKLKNSLCIVISALFIISSLIFISPTASFAVSNNPTPVCASGTCTITFAYSGDYYSWTVPAGVTTLTVDVRGARGGNGILPTCSNASVGSYGGLGGKVTGVLSVTSGSSLFIYVGGKGEDGITSRNSGGFNGGGGAGYYGGNPVTGPCYPGTGGGASDIRTTAGTLSSRLIVAGGGGGAGGFTPGSGGAGGVTTGGSGTCTNYPTGNGGGGTPTAGGTAGSVCAGASAGSLGVGGYGRGCSHGGGGGGGGYYGGGGGLVEPGGGGSSFANASYATSIVHTQGAQNGDGQILVSYSSAPDTTAPTFTSSSTFSAAENIATSATAATIRISESATVTISSGADTARFNITKSDTDTAIIKFNASPDFEAPADVGGNNVYELTLTATDAASNAGTQSITITVTDVVDTSSFNSLALAGGATTAIYRTVVVITANVSVASRVTFRVNGKVLPGCKNRLASGSGSSYSVTCSWKPSNRGAISLTAAATPTGAGISSVTSNPVSVMVGKRAGSR